MRIVSSDDVKLRELESILSAKRIRLDDGLDILVLPKTMPLPDIGVVIAYDEDRPEDLAEFLSAIRPAASAVSRDMVVGRSSQGYTVVPLRDVQYFVASGNYVYCRTSRDRFEVNKKLFEIEKDYKARYFFRIHKSYVINIRWVREIFPWFGGRLLIKMRETEEEVEVSRNYVKAFKEALGI